MLFAEGLRQGGEEGRPVYRAAIVGCGRIGCFFDDDPKRPGIWTHAGAYAACARTQLVALADVDPKARELAGRRWGVTRLYSDVESMLRSEQVDILSVCTPSDTHACAVRVAAAAEVPAVWCEKPLAVSLQEMDEIVALSAARVIAVNHTRRWDRAYETAQEWIRNGRTGKLIGATAWYTHGVANIGSHLFDTLRFLLGDAEWVWAAPDRSGEPDPTLSGVVGFTGGFLCQVAGCGRDVLLFEIDLIGTEGRLRISDNGARVEAWAVGPSAKYSGYREPGSRSSLWEGQDGNRMLTAVQDIIGCLEYGRRPRCSAEDGRAAAELVAAFLRSAAMGELVKLPIPRETGDVFIPVR